MLLLVDYVYEDYIISKKFRGKDAYKLVNRVRDDENFKKCIQVDYNIICDEDAENVDQQRECSETGVALER